MIPSCRTLKYKNLQGGISMSRKSKTEPAEKVKIVEQYLRGEIGLNDATRLSGADSNNTVIAWIRIYENAGPLGLLEQPHNQSYSKEIKLNAVLDYLNGKGSQNDICKKYQIRSRSQLMQWIKVYNSGRSLKETTGGASMKKARATTFEERLQIVKECINNEKNYGAMAIKYNCSYQQVRNWVKRYEQMGSAGLEDRRGRRAGTQPSRSLEEELRDKIAELEYKNKDLQMKNDLLKKVKELERGNRYR